MFGVRDSGDERLIGIPRSPENQKHLTDKLSHAEPALDFEVRNPQPLVDEERVLLIAEIRVARRGPHSYVTERGAREFWRRGEGTAVRMTYPEIQGAFTNYAERLTRVNLVFLSLADNWARLREVGGRPMIDWEIAPNAPDMSQVRQHLVDINSLCPDAMLDLFAILQISDLSNCCDERNHARHEPRANRR